MKTLSLAAASIALCLLAAPALAGRPQGDQGNNNNNQGNNNNNNDPPRILTTPSPQAAIGLPALVAGAATIIYLRSRRRKAG